MGEVQRWRWGGLGVDIGRFRGGVEGVLEGGDG